MAIRPICKLFYSYLRWIFWQLCTILIASYLSILPAHILNTPSIACTFFHSNDVLSDTHCLLRLSLEHSALSRVPCYRPHISFDTTPYTLGMCLSAILLRWQPSRYHSTCWSRSFAVSPPLSIHISLTSSLHDKAILVPFTTAMIPTATHLCSHGFPSAGSLICAFCSSSNSSHASCDVWASKQMCSTSGMSRFREW